MKNSIVIIALFFLSVVPLLPLFRGGIPYTHDGQDHVVRIANFYASLSEGIAVPRWGANLNWGYGHPILSFLYPFSSYVASGFHAIGFSFEASTKLVFGILYVISILGMYAFMRKGWGKLAGVVGAILYGFAPYRFVDLYVRGAIGEHAAFVFPPLLCLCLLFIARKRHRILSEIGLSLTTACLILSHNAIAIMILPVVILYCFYLFLTESKKSFSFLFSSFYFMALGFGLSAFFWVPAFFEGKYTLRNIVTAGEALTRFVAWQSFITPSWNYGGTADLSKFVGYAQWIGIISSLYVIVKTKDRNVKVLLGILCVLFILSLFIMTDYAYIVWKKVMILQNFQFPWRFLSLTVFISAVMGGISIPIVLRKKWVPIVIFCIFAVGSTYMMWHPKGYITHDESFYTGIYKGTTDTGESSPIWSVRFMEHTPPNFMDVIDGEAVITLKKRTTTMHEYEVQVSKPARLVEQTLFFPGWKIYVDGIGAGLQFQDPAYRGLMTFRIDEGVHTVRAVFTDTHIRSISYMISIGSIAFLIISVCMIIIVCRRIK